MILLLVLYAALKRKSSKKKTNKSWNGNVLWVVGKYVYSMFYNDDDPLESERKRRCSRFGMSIRLHHFKSS